MFMAGDDIDVRTAIYTTSVRFPVGFGCDTSLDNPTVKLTISVPSSSEIHYTFPHEIAQQRYSKLRIPRRDR
jgi:hypothetical protein